MTKILGWRTTLFDVISEYANQRFEWGVRDCACFSADAVRAQTGADPMGDLRGAYTDAKGAKRALKRRGFLSLVHLLSSGFNEVPVAFAGVGDLAYKETGGLGAVGVVAGDRVFFMREDGLGTVDLMQVDRVFRVS